MTTNSIWEKLRNSLHLIWSLEAKHKFAQVLDESKPDIVHIHNIYHHLTPSILSVAKKRNIPIVMTVHDYNLINHNYLLFDHNQICERTGWQSLKHKCICNSYFKTLVSLTKFFVQQKTQVYQKNVDLFLCPTEFVKKKLVQGGFEESKIKVLSLPIDIKQKGVVIPHSLLTAPYILFAGRLSPEKGIDLLLKITSLLPNINFVIAGDGPYNNGTMQQCNNVKKLGHLPHPQLRETMQQARLIIIPSLCYETANLVVLEAMSLGKTVMASKLGGIQNLITDNKDGFLLPLIYTENNKEAEDSPSFTRRGLGGGLDLDQTAQTWAEKIKTIFNDQKFLNKIGQEAQKTIKARNNPEKHYKKLVKIYEAVSRDKQSKPR